MKLNFLLEIFRGKAYIFTFIPAGGSGDFNVNLHDVRVSLLVLLRNTDEGLSMEHFKGIGRKPKNVTN